MKVGDEVTWTSQSGGRTTTKRGTIVAVVPAMQVSRYGGGGWRNHESYVVAVPGKGTYWPRVSALKPVERARG